MKNSEHTPGPWYWFHGSLLAGHGNRPVVLTASSHNRTPYISTRAEGGLLEHLTADHPNARLIAAAPELLEALKNLRREFLLQVSGRTVSAPIIAVYDAAGDAIAKVEPVKEGGAK